MEERSGKGRERGRYAYRVPQMSKRRKKRVKKRREFGGPRHGTGYLYNGENEKGWENLLLLLRKGEKTATSPQNFEKEIRGNLIRIHIKRKGDKSKPENVLNKGGPRGVPSAVSSKKGTSDCITH